MNKYKIRQTVLLVAAVVVVAVIILIIVAAGREKSDSHKIGLIITGETTDDGWNGVHYRGVLSACEKLGAELIIKENIAEGSGECRQAIQELADDGVKMIILSSYAYPAEVMDVIGKYPDIAFYTSSFDYSAENLTSYFGRMYQARYLAGVVAGMQTENGNIGYVAAMQNNEVNRGINAFTLGVRSVNPDATVYVSFTDSWDDMEKEVKSADSLIKNKSVDVITYHQNRHYVAETADKAGIYSIGYNEVAEGLSDKYLTATVWDWDTLYYQIIREYMQGKPNAMERRWFSIDSGVVSLSEFSSEVSDKTRKETESAKNRLSGGNDVFSGPVYDNNGILKCRKGEILSDDTLLKNMEWFVEGVEIYNDED